MLVIPWRHGILVLLHVLPAELPVWMAARPVLAWARLARQEGLVAVIRGPHNSVEQLSWHTERLLVESLVALVYTGVLPDVNSMVEAPKHLAVPFVAL